jgi:hypothetical protein
VLETIGFDAAVAASFAPWRAADAAVGRVVRVDRGVATVLTEAGPDRVSFGGALLSELAEDPDRTPCAGDWVVVRSWPDGPHTLERVLERRSVVRCPAGSGQGTVRAANVDVVVLLPGRGADLLPPELADGVEVVSVDPDAPAALEGIRAALGARRTVALLGRPPSVAALLELLVGAPQLSGRQSGAELIVVPGGGVTVDLTVATSAPTEDGRRAARPVS